MVHDGFLRQPGEGAPLSQAAQARLGRGAAVSDSQRLPAIASLNATPIPQLPAFAGFELRGGGANLSFRGARSAEPHRSQLGQDAERRLFRPAASEVEA